MIDRDSHNGASSFTASGVPLGADRKLENSLGVKGPFVVLAEIRDNVPIGGNRGQLR